MKARFPLYAKVLLWFFLNLVLVAAAFYTLLRAQFHFGPDWLLATGADDRLEAVSNLVFSELEERPRAEWDGVLKRYRAAYQVQFLLFAEPDGLLAGEALVLPPAVRQRLSEGGRPAPRGPRAGPPAREFPPPGVPRHLDPSSPGGPRPDPQFPRGEPPPDARFGPPPPPPGPPRRPHPKLMVRTAHPTRYWALVRAVLPDRDRERPVPVTLVAVASSLSGGGLFFDLKPWLAVGLGAMVCSALWWFPLVRGMTRSLAQIARATQQIAEGRFAARVETRRRDELGLLSEAINRMAARLEGLVAGQKRFLGDIAHELCSPLARLRLALGILEQHADPTQAKHVQSANAQAAEMASLVNELLSFSKASLGSAATKLRPVDVQEAARQAIQREALEAQPFELAVPAGLAVLAEPELLGRALANLVRNAVRYAGQGGPITITAKREGDEVLVVVADEGPGIPSDQLAKVFDPFYRVEASRDRTSGGVGLGLAIVKTCVEACGGSVACRNRQPRGLEAVIRLRAAALSGADPSGPESPRPA